MPKIIKQKGRWGIDRKISITNVAQLFAVITFGVSFYNQVNNNQTRNEERFAQFSEERKLQTDHMLKMQEAQNQMLLELTKITDHENYITDTIKDLTNTIKERRIK